MKCNFSDCFTCQYHDCINNSFNKPIVRSRAYKERAKQYQKALREERKNQGLCVYCGKRKSDNGFATCFECRNAQRKKKIDRDRAKGTTPRVLMDGVSYCTKCGKNPPTVGTKLCANCLDHNRKVLKEINERRANGGRNAK